MASARLNSFLLFVSLFVLRCQILSAHASGPFVVSKRDLVWADVNLENILDGTLRAQHSPEVDDLKAGVLVRDDYNGWVMRSGDPLYPTMLVGGVENTNRAMQILVVFPKNYNSMYWGAISYDRLMTVLTAMGDDFEKRYRDTRQKLLEDGPRCLQSRLKVGPNLDGIKGGGKPVGIIFAPDFPNGELSTMMETVIQRLKTNFGTMLEKYNEEIEVWHVFRFGNLCNKDGCSDDPDSDSENEDDDCVVFSDNESADAPDMTEENNGDEPAGPNNDGVGDAEDDGAVPLAPWEFALAYRQIDKVKMLWEWTMYFGSVNNGMQPAFTPRQFTYIKRKTDPLGGLPV